MASLLTYNEFKATINKQELSHIYCFCGDEQLQKEEAVLKIASIIFKSKKPEDYTIATYFADDNLELALSKVLSHSLFDSASLYVIKHCENVTANKKIHSMFRDCVANIPDASYVIFDTQENNPPSLIPADSMKSIPAVQFYRPFAENCKKYIYKKCNSLKLTITEEAADHLVEFTASNIKEIDDILNLISFSETTDITIEFLEGFLINERGSIEFEFVDTFFLKDKSALMLFQEALHRNINQVLLLTLLFNHAQKIEAYHIKTQKGNTPESLMKELKIYGKRQKVFAKQAIVFNLESIRKFIANVYVYDYKLKSYRFKGIFQENPMYDLLLQYLV